jgi:hypothetical protein
LQQLLSAGKKPHEPVAFAATRSLATLDRIAQRARAAARIDTQNRHQPLTLFGRGNRLEAHTDLGQG